MLSRKIVLLKFQMLLKSPFTPLTFIHAQKTTRWGRGKFIIISTTSPLFFFSLLLQTIHFSRVTCPCYFNKKKKSPLYLISICVGVKKTLRWQYCKWEQRCLIHLWTIQPLVLFFRILLLYKMTKCIFFCSLSVQYIFSRHWTVCKTDTILTTRWVEKITVKIGLQKLLFKPNADIFVWGK